MNHYVVTKKSLGVTLAWSEWAFSLSSFVKNHLGRFPSQVHTCWAEKSHKV